MSMKNENCLDGKFSKERVSVLVGANMSGNWKIFIYYTEIDFKNFTGSEKLPLLVIGKLKNPRCFKNIQSLPTKYKNNSRAWMTSILFEEEFKEWDEKLRIENRFVLAVVDKENLHFVSLVFRREIYTFSSILEEGNVHFAPIFRTKKILELKRKIYIFFHPLAGKFTHIYKGKLKN